MVLIQLYCEQIYEIKEAVMNQKKTRVIALSIPEDLLAWIDRTADEELRSRSNQICRLLNYARTDILNEEYASYPEVNND